MAAITFTADPEISSDFRFLSTATKSLKAGLLRHLVKLADIPENELD
jgi:hypothetical protein